MCYPDGKWLFSVQETDKMQGKDLEIALALQSRDGGVYMFHLAADASNGVEKSKEGRSDILKDAFNTFSAHNYAVELSFPETKEGKAKLYEEQEKKKEKLRKEEKEAKERHDEKLAAEKKADLAQEYDMLEVNCRAVLTLCHFFSKRLARRGYGGMVLMASLVGFQGVPNAAHYAATKAYVQSLAEALHVELAPLGVNVLASAPGPVNSGFAVRAGMRMGMALRPAEVAQATLNALGRKTTAVPGLLSKVLTWSLLPLPRSARVRIMGAVMRGMTKHLDEKA
jgi:hypothetical protein